MRISVQPGLGLANDVSIVYFGGKDVRLMSIAIEETPIMIVDDRLTLYRDGYLLKTSLTNFQSITSAPRREEEGQGCVIYVLMDHRVFSFPYSQLRFQHKYHRLCDAENPLFVRSHNFLFTVSQHDDCFQLFDLRARVASDPHPGRVVCSATSQNHIVLAVAGGEVLVFSYENRNFRHRFTTRLESAPTQLAFNFENLLVAFETSLRVAFLSDDRLRFHRCVLSLPSPITSFVGNEFVWAVFADGRLATLLYQQSADCIEFLAVSPPRSITHVFPIDDLSAAAVSPGLLSFFRIRAGTFHGARFPLARDYAEIGALPLSGVTALCRAGDCLVYFNDSGAAGGLVGLNCSVRFRALLALQRDVHRGYAAAVGFSVASNRLASPDFVDLDMLDSYRRFAVNEDENRSKIAEMTAGERMRFAF
jgi:hypothetical protein